MKGLELAKAYYERYGKEMLEEKFPAYRGRIASGLAGEGSDCLGYDDDFSRDHDFGPGFCLWLTDGDEAEIGKSLRAAYGELPGEFLGYPARNPRSYGEQRLSAMRTSGFYRKFTGQPNGPETPDEWRRIPEHFLSAAVSGQVFADELGSFTGIRKKLLGFYPEDIRLKKIAARAALMAQAGQYNYHRCEQRKEDAAAHLALGEFLKAACSMVHLLNRKYMPYYKWAHRSLMDLPLVPEAYGLIRELCAYGTESRRRLGLIEELCAAVLRELKAQGLSGGEGDFLLDHCPEIMEGIRDPNIRKLPVMMGE